MTAWISLASVANHLRATCFTTDPMRWKSLVPILPTGPRTTAGKLWTTPPTVPSSCSMISIFWGPLRKHLTGDRFATEANGKQAVTFRLKSLDTTFFYARLQAAVPWRTDAFMSVVTPWRSEGYHTLHLCHVHAEVRVTFFLSGCLLPYFLKPLYITIERVRFLFCLTCV